MNKTFLIIQREYLTRVRKKSFILMSFLGPVLFALIGAVIVYIMSREDTDEKTIGVIDKTELYAEAFEDSDFLKFKMLDGEVETTKTSLEKQGYYAYIVIEEDLLEKPSAIQMYSDGQVTVELEQQIRRNLRRYLKDVKLKSFEIENLSEIIESLNKINVDITTIRLGEDGESKETSSVFAMILGMISAMFIYMFLLIYGTQVMRGVIEEKTNRIVEVMISSVKPFQLMMGKIVGVGLVALTQFIIWITLSTAFLYGGGALFQSQSAKIQAVNQQVELAQGVNPEVAVEANVVQGKITDVIKVFEGVNMAMIIFYFFFYFIGGYLIYAALFATIGSVIDNETDTQQFIMPVMLPLILAIYIAMSAMKAPHSDLSFWASIIPFTSPVVMMARLPYGISFWEILVSMLVLIGAFILLTWFAGRIYKTGILMYGKKPSYKEIWKWFLQSGK